MRSAYCQRAGAAHDEMPYVERGAGERHAGPHEVIAGRRVGRKRAQLGQGGEIASWEPRRKGNKEDAARPGCGSGREAATTRGEAAWSSGLRRAWGNGRSTCDALRRGMRKVCLDDRFGEPEAILHGRFPGTGRPAEALCTQPVTSVEGRSALRTPTFAKRPSWVTYSESKLDPSRSVPGLGTKPPDFYGDETWKSQNSAHIIHPSGPGNKRRGRPISQVFTRIENGLRPPSPGQSQQSIHVPERRVSIRNLVCGPAAVLNARSSGPPRTSQGRAGRSASYMSNITQRVRARRRPHQVVLHRHQAHIDQDAHAGCLRPGISPQPRLRRQPSHRNLTPQPGNSHTTAAWDEGRIAPTEPGTCTPRHHRH